VALPSAASSDAERMPRVVYSAPGLHIPAATFNATVSGSIDFDVNAAVPTVAAFWRRGTTA